MLLNHVLGNEAVQLTTQPPNEASHQLQSAVQRATAAEQKAQEVLTQLEMARQTIQQKEEAASTLRTQVYYRRPNTYAHSGGASSYPTTKPGFWLVYKVS